MSLTQTIDAGTVVRELVDILEDLTQGWDVAYPGPITAATRLVGDLGCESLDFVMLIVKIQERFQRKGLPFEELFQTEAGPAADLTVGQLAAFVEQELARG